MSIKIIGEWLGLDIDQGLFTHFRVYYAEEFLSLSQIKQTIFLRQAAHLCLTHTRLWRDLLNRTGFDNRLSLMDSFLVPFVGLLVATGVEFWSQLGNRVMVRLM